MTPPQGARQLLECAEKGLNFKQRIGLKHQTTLYSGQPQKMIEHHVQIRNVLPSKEVLVPANRIIHKAISEFGAAGRPVFVNDAARRRHHTFPAAFPGLIRKIGILHIKRGIKTIESTDLLVFPAVKGARSPASPEDRDYRSGFIFSVNLVVPKIEKSAVESSAGFSGLFPAPRWIGKEDLGGDGKYRSIRKAVEKGF